MKNFNTASLLEKPERHSAKLILLAELRSALSETIGELPFDPLSLRNPRNPGNDRLVRNYTPEQQRTSALSTIMDRIKNQMRRDMVDKLDLPYYSRAFSTTTGRPSGRPPVDETDAYIETSHLFLPGGDDGWTITSSVYVQPNGAGGCYAGTHGRKILTSEQVASLLRKAVERCKDHRPETNSLVHRFASSSTPWNVMHQSVHEAWRQRQKFELEGNTGPNPF